MRFLDRLAREGSVAGACAAVGVSRQTAYLARRRDAGFARAWEAALVLARGAVEDVLATRAIHGTLEDVFYHGEKVATRRRFDARLLLAHLARLDARAEAGAGEDAGRFDELLALVGGLEPADCGVADRSELARGYDMAVDPLLPPDRAAYVGMAGAATTSLEGYWENLYEPGDDEAAEEDGAEEGAADVEAGEEDDETDAVRPRWEDDDADDDEETPEDRAAQRRHAEAMDRAERAAEREWDRWHLAACRLVDGYAAEDGDDAAWTIEAPVDQAGADGAGAGVCGAGGGEGPAEFKSLDGGPALSGDWGSGDLGPDDRGPGDLASEPCHMCQPPRRGAGLTRLGAAARGGTQAPAPSLAGGGCGTKGKAMITKPRARSGRSSMAPRAAGAARALAVVALAGCALGAAAPALGAEKVRMMAELTGAQVVGRAADSDGSGRFVAALDARARQLCYEIEVRLIGQASAAAIYAGRTGRAAASGLVSLTPPDARGASRGCTAVSARAAKQMASDPSALHISIHNALYPGGALRGQLAAGGPGLSAAQGDVEPAPPAQEPARPPRERRQGGAVFTGS